MTSPPPKYLIEAAFEEIIGELGRDNGWSREETLYRIMDDYLSGPGEWSLSCFRAMYARGYVDALKAEEGTP